MRTLRKTAAVAAIATFTSGASVQAATIAVDTFSAADYDAATAFIDPIVSQDFEDWAVPPGNAASDGANGVNIVDGTDIGVGSVRSTGGTGSGGTVNGRGSFTGNDGSLLAVRDGNVYGRVSTTQFQSFGGGGDDQFLDSNDTFGIEWTVSAGGEMFDAVVFTMTDATDVGATMRITAGGASEEYTNLRGSNNRRDGNAQIVQILFGQKVQQATITLANFTSSGARRLNDGFSLDDMLVGAQVPLPAAGWLLLGGLGGLVVMKRRRKA